MISLSKMQMICQLERLLMSEIIQKNLKHLSSSSKKTSKNFPFPILKAIHGE